MTKPIPTQRVGYGRVSTVDQDTAIQEQALKDAGCHTVFVEQVSGTSTANRDELERALGHVRSGDTLVVTRLDRLARNTSDLLTIINQLSEAGVGFECIEQSMISVKPGVQDATSTLMLTMLAGIAEFETGLRKERQAEGIAKAKADGKGQESP